MAKHMVQYLHFRILEFPLTIWLKCHAFPLPGLIKLITAEDMSNGTHLARLWKLILLTSLMRTCFFLWNLKGSGSIGKSSINGITKIETFAFYDFSSCLCLILTFDWGHSTKSSSRDLTIWELIMNVSQRHPVMKKGCTQILKCHLVVVSNMNFMFHFII